MTTQPSQDDILTWHRYFAVECNNAAWELIDQPERSAAESQALLYRAYAGAYHWSFVGKPVNLARAEILLAHAHSLLDQGELAMQYARSAFAFFQSGQGEDWDIAFAHLEIAFAAEVMSDQRVRDYHYQLALDKGEAIQDPEDRDIFMRYLHTLPRS